MVEKVARDEVIRGYFSDEHVEDIRFSQLKVDLQMRNLAKNED